MEAATPLEEQPHARAWAPLTAGEKERLFDRTLEEQGPRVLAIARAVTRDHHDAQDVAQEAFISFHSALARDVIRKDAGAWLRAVAANLAFARARRRDSRRHSPITDELAEGLADPASASAQDLDAYRGIMPVIETLPEKQRQAFVLRTFEGLSYRDIGDILGCASETARKHYQLAKRQLRARAGSYFRA